MKKLVLSIALIGFGTFAMAQQNEYKPEQKEKMEQNRGQKGRDNLAEMQKELHLNDSQVSQIKALHDRNKMERKNEMDKKKGMKQGKMKEKRAQNDAEMRKILTPDQFSKWQQKRDEKIKEIKGQRKDKKGNFKRDGREANMQTQ